VKIKASVTSLLIFVIITVTVSVLQYNKGSHSFSTGTYTSINNYQIFKTSFYNLVEGNNLYVHYPEKHHDLYKYSPAFALAMGAIAWMPDIAGFTLWNLLNALLLLLFWWKLPLRPKQKLWGSLLLLPELIISLQNGQSNGLLTASILGAWVMYEHKKPQAAAIWINIGLFTKLFAIAGAVFAIFHSGKLRAVFWGVFIGILLLLLPIIITGPEQLLNQYSAWWNLLKNDPPGPLPLSVPGAAEKIFQFSSAIIISQIIGVLLLFSPLLRTEMYQNLQFRLYMLSMVLLWVVLWNHKAESPTYIIAVTGSMLWYFLQPWSRWRIVMIMLVLVFTSLSQSDLFPHYIRTEVFQPFLVKMIPCLLVFLIAWIEIMRLKKAL
jgi:hypothetical protein